MGGDLPSWFWPVLFLLLAAEASLFTFSGMLMGAAWVGRIMLFVFVVLAIGTAAFKLIRGRF